MQDEGDDKKKTFEELGLCDELVAATSSLGWKYPTKIQAEGDSIGARRARCDRPCGNWQWQNGCFLATNAAYAFSCATARDVFMAPTRELAFQIHEVLTALGASVGAKSLCIVGGVDIMSQAISLARKPHFIVATPGRLVDHLENTKGFNLRSLKVLCLDEADRMLSMDFEEEINKVLQVIPRERTTFLFSATMTSKVAKLQRASLQDPVRVEVATKYQTASTLVQQYMFALYAQRLLSCVPSERARGGKRRSYSPAHAITRSALLSFFAIWECVRCAFTAK